MESRYSSTECAQKARKAEGILAALRLLSDLEGDTEEGIEHDMRATRTEEKPKPVPPHVSFHDHAPYLV